MCIRVHLCLNPEADPADRRNMRVKRKEERNLCAELIEILWQDDQAVGHSEFVTLEDISRTGVSLGSEGPVPLQTRLTLKHPSGTYLGQVRYCRQDQAGYVIGVQLDQGSYWSRKQFRPDHLVQFRLRPVK
jgi:hypothetical protein